MLFLVLPNAPCIVFKLPLGCLTVKDWSPTLVSTVTAAHTTYLSETYIGTERTPSISQHFWHSSFDFSWCQYYALPRNILTQRSFQELEYFYFQKSYKQRHTGSVQAHQTSIRHWLPPLLPGERSSICRSQLCWLTFSAQ